MSPALMSCSFLAIAILFKFTACNIFDGKIPEDGRLNFTALAEKYGYKAESYEVTTEDGYVLTMFRIPGNASRPVFLQHGSYTSSDDFLVRTNASLCASLANAGYDVWAGNLRGNRYSRKHVRLNPDVDTSFWDFGIDEHGLYDLPAMIDFVLEKTNQTKLITIGHSLGTTIYFAMGAAKPEYNDKIKVFIALAPIVFGSYIKDPVKTLSLLTPLVTAVADVIQLREVTGWYSPIRNFAEILCTDFESSYDICVKTFLFPTSGDDGEELEPAFLPILIGHAPAGTSYKLLQHFSQLVNEARFAKFNYGLLKNLEYYNSTKSPEYDLSKVTMNIALLVGKNDRLATVLNAQAIRAHVPNIVRYITMEPPKWNHVDFTYARNGFKILHPLIFDIIKEYD